MWTWKNFSVTNSCELFWWFSKCLSCQSWLFSHQKTYTRTWKLSPHISHKTSPLTSDFDGFIAKKFNVLYFSDFWGVRLCILVHKTSIRKSKLISLNPLNIQLILQARNFPPMPVYLSDPINLSHLISHDRQFQLNYSSLFLPIIDNQFTQTLLCLSHKMPHFVKFHEFSPHHKVQA